MAMDKNQLRRIRILISMFCSHKEVNVKNFLARYNEETSINEETWYSKRKNEAGEVVLVKKSQNVSSRTFNRDIRMLQETYNAPLKYSPRSKSWKLIGAWNPQQTFMGTFDCEKALLCERIASSFLPAKMQMEIQNSIGGILAEKSGSWTQRISLENFCVIPPEGNFVDGRIFLKVFNAWKECETIVVNYNDSKGVEKQKTFEPHVFAWHNNTWYLKGKLLQNKTSLATIIKDPPEIQVLALHRISSVMPMASPKKFIPDPTILEQVKKTGLFNFKKIPAVEIVFHDFAARKMAERFEGKPDCIMEKTENSLRIKLKNIAEHEAVSLALSANGNAEIITPQSLRKTMYDIALEIMERHK